MLRIVQPSNVHVPPRDPEAESMPVAYKPPPECAAVLYSIVLSEKVGAEFDKYTPPPPRCTEDVFFEPMPSAVLFRMVQPLNVPFALPVDWMPNDKPPPDEAVLNSMVLSVNVGSESIFSRILCMHLYQVHDNREWPQLTLLRLKVLLYQTLCWRCCCE